MATVNALSQNTLDSAELPTLWVAPDQLATTTKHPLLLAHLDGSIALCFYDAVEEQGLLLHLRVLPRGNVKNDLTDSVFTGNLVLLEQAKQALRKVEPTARYWQCKLVAQLSADDPMLNRAANTVVDFIRQYFIDSNIKLVDAQLRTGGPSVLQFRPAMGEVRVKSLSP